MNRAQKNAWFGLVNSLLAIVFCASFVLGRMFFSIPVPGFKFAPQPSQTEIIIKAILWFWPMVLPFIALILLLIPRKKESPAEPDFDELDAAIQNKAIRVSFISVWLVWPLVLALIMLMFGIATPLPAVYYCFIHLGVFVICMAIYFLTKVLLYRKQTKGNAA
jgi:hypothetical protein